MRRFPLKRLLITSSLTLVLMIVAAWFGGRWYFAGTVLDTDGRATLTGLDAPVEIEFDARGIPRIRARTDADALRALGWLHAAERGFQMELMRAVARGELAEKVGAGALDSDRLHHRFGFARRVELEPPELSPGTGRLLQAYVDGINRRLERGDLPPGLVLLGGTPRPWTVADVLTLAYYQTWYPTTLVQRLAEAWRAAGRTGAPDMAEWLETLPDWGVPSVPGQRMTEASNTWVVAPERSASGRALHASDPHLDTTMAPGLWYAAGLHSQETLDVVGVTVPGLPFVAMGHNGEVAFAFTVAPVDLFEFYRFERLDGGKTLLRGPDGPVTIQEHSVDIVIGNAEATVRETIRTTEHGVIVDENDETVTVMRWAGFELPIGDLVENGLALNRARTFADFRAAASNMGALSVNWSYSDRAGNIGYVQSTPVPMRTHDRFYVTLDGADPRNHWAGFLPPDARPYALNPPQGWLANANNHAAVDVAWPMPGFYKHLRMRRAADWLSGNQILDRATMHAMQLDIVSERALLWKDWLAGVAERTGRTPLAAELHGWDGTMAADSMTAGLFALWWQYLPDRLFAEGPVDPHHGRTLLDDWLAAPDAAPVSVVERDVAAARALDDALRGPRRPLGAIQTLTIAHPLARAGLLDRWLDLARGPLPIGGGPGALNVTYHRWDPHTEQLRAAAGASMRFVMDWADVDGFTLNLALGQSGHPLSPHFDDFLADWQSGTPWTVPWSSAAVDAATASTLRLLPD
ncbi:penicillin acylase family protein [Wenzhouxiangella sp. XN79A]|uniref:penicillin acylase family protein n=1 Tax=Wenzhouxiangella sp. XN79A TaxID=2724193 RepID=UPI00144A9BE7|nr:penicillin acylase family protein [Wenzhouxiangella sp. XN79A]NKI35991.1 penicillin acylase family protein [Wenzhouxiangella sp. XN79A]